VKQHGPVLGPYKQLETDKTYRNYNFMDPDL